MHLKVEILNKIMSSKLQNKLSKKLILYYQQMYIKFTDSDFNYFIFLIFCIKYLANITEEKKRLYK